VDGVSVRVDAEVAPRSTSASEASRPTRRDLAATCSACGRPSADGEAVVGAGDDVHRDARLRRGTPNAVAAALDHEPRHAGAAARPSVCAGRPGAGAGGRPARSTPPPRAAAAFRQATRAPAHCAPAGPAAASVASTACHARSSRAGASRPPPAADPPGLLDPHTSSPLQAGVARGQQVGASTPPPAPCPRTCGPRASPSAVVRAGRRASHLRDERGLSTGRRV
jgi:hypothetical protein